MSSRAFVKLCFRVLHATEPLSPCFCCAQRFSVDAKAHLAPRRRSAWRFLQSQLPVAESVRGKRCRQLLQLVLRELSMGEDDASLSEKKDVDEETAAVDGADEEGNVGGDGNESEAGRHGSA